MDLKFECVEDALRTAIQSSGKSQKEVACAVWPTLTAEQASQRLRSVLNPTKREKLSFDEFIFISNYIGVYFGLEHLNLCCGFEAKPIKKEDTLASLQLQLEDVITKVGHISRIVNSLQDD